VNLCAVPPHSVPSYTSVSSCSEEFTSTASLCHHVPSSAVVYRHPLLRCLAEPSCPPSLGQMRECSMLQRNTQNQNNEIALHCAPGLQPRPLLRPQTSCGFSPSPSPERVSGLHSMPNCTTHALSIARAEQGMGHFASLS